MAWGNEDAKPQDAEGKEPSSRRDAVIRAIRDRPGASIQEVADELDLSHSTVRYHVKVLAERGLVERAQDGRAVRLFVGRQSLAKRVAPLLRDPAREQILEYLNDQPMSYLSINRIATDLDLEFGLVKRTLHQLAELGIIDLDLIMGRYRLREVKDIGRLLDQPTEEMH